MSNAARDENNVPTLIAVQPDGETVVRVKADPTTHSLAIADGDIGSDNGPTNAARDENFVTTLVGVSSVDGVTPVVVYADANGNLLVDSN